MDSNTALILYSPVTLLMVAYLWGMFWLYYKHSKASHEDQKRKGLRK